MGSVGKPTIDDVGDMTDFLKEKLGNRKSLDFIVEGKTPGEDPERARKIVEAWANAGATWWTETM